MEESSYLISEANVSHHTNLENSTRIFTIKAEKGKKLFN